MEQDGVKFLLSIAVRIRSVMLYYTLPQRLLLGGGGWPREDAGVWRMKSEEKKIEG